MFSKACEYAIRAVIYIALQSMQGQRANLTGIALEIGSPRAFTAKILQQLVKQGIVNSLKGRSGGFMIESSELQSIRLIDVVRAMDGDALYIMCSLGMKECSEAHPCPVHHQYKGIREQLIRMMEESRIANMAQRLKEGGVFLTQ